jgi:hypothetical protein
MGHGVGTAGGVELVEAATRPTKADDSAAIGADVTSFGIGGSPACPHILGRARAPSAARMGGGADAALTGVSRASDR